jgi:hypothetical protein
MIPVEILLKTNFSNCQPDISKEKGTMYLTYWATIMEMF